MMQTHDRFGNPMYDVVAVVDGVRVVVYGGLTLAVATQMAEGDDDYIVVAAA